MLEQAWTKVGILCPDCKQQVQLDDVAASADGELRISGICPKCKERVSLRVFATALAHQSLCNDIERCHKARPVVPVSRRLSPPLALPKPSEELTAEDRRWERAMGIDPDGPRTMDDIIRDVDQDFPPLGKEEK